jgi:CTP synthase
VACQFHPELKSRPTRPHPLFSSFVAAAAQHAQHSPARARGRAELAEAN